MSSNSIKMLSSQYHLKTPKPTEGNKGDTADASGMDAGTLSGTSYTPQKVFFPLELANEDGHGFMHFMAAKNYKFMRKEVKRNDVNSGHVGGVNEVQSHIFLPLPNNLRTAYTAAYENANLGVIGAGAGNFTSEAGSISAITDKIKNIGSADIDGDMVRSAIKSGVGASSALITQGLAGGGGTGGALVGAVLGGLMGGIGGSIVGAAAKGGLAGIGTAVNPYIAQIFTGVDLRKHSFEYELVAKNEQESEHIKKMIDIFKFHMLPSYKKSNHFFSYPEQFDIRIKFPGYAGSSFAFDIGASVLTDFNVDYTGQGAPYFFESGAPVSVKISMTFQESTITTKEDVVKQDQRGAVTGLGGGR